jgi:hypothetical protein
MNKKVLNIGFLEKGGLFTISRKKLVKKGKKEQHVQYMSQVGVAPLSTF